MRPDVIFDVFDHCRCHKWLLGGVCGVCFGNEKGFNVGFNIELPSGKVLPSTAVHNHGISDMTTSWSLMSLYSHRWPPFRISKGTRSIYMLIPKWLQTPYGYGESPNAIFFVSLPLPYRDSPYGYGDCVFGHPFSHALKNIFFAEASHAHRANISHFTIWGSYCNPRSIITLLPFLDICLQHE